MRLLLLASISALALMACRQARPNINTEGLGRACPATGCAVGQACVTSPSPTGPPETCEIKCDQDSDCPQGYRCNLPPALPDSLLDVCIRN